MAFIRRCGEFSLLPYIILLVVIGSSFVDASASWDTLTWGGSNDRTGYESNHNMDPSVVGSGQFGLLYKKFLPGNYGGYAEQIFAQPLIYTDSSNTSYVYLATTQNNVYKMNAKTGDIVASRNLARPFLQSDLGNCNDINPHIGVTATGVIDDATATWYLTSKTYIDQSSSGGNGLNNARYFVHAISLADLSERPNYPVNLEYTVSRNNPTRWFTGGIHHQRPGLLLQERFVYIGFASHCVQYNYTGWIMGLDKSSGQIVERFSTEGAGVGPSQSGAGVWMSGGGIASDGPGSMYFSTGNGQSGQLGDASVQGKTPPTALEEAVVHAAINSDGTITPVDFFMPWEKAQLDHDDKDLGTSPFQLLPAAFSCGSIKRIGMVTGKTGKTYWLNIDDLGGYKMGANKLDAIIQVYQHENSVYSGAGVYPLTTGGGYIYVNVIGYPTRVFQFICSNGSPSFVSVATTAEKNAGNLGVGHGTVTSLNGNDGSGLFWVSDMQNGNLRVYKAVPDGATLTLLNTYNANDITKFTKLAFGNGIVFQGSVAGYIYAYSSPVNLPLDCTSAQFEPTNINSTSTVRTIQCQALTQVTITSASLTGPSFNISGLPTFPIQITKGSNFSFQAVFNPKTVGALSSSVMLNTTQATGYATNTPVKLSGQGISQNPILQVSPNVVTWNGVITGQDPNGVNQSMVLLNAGNSSLTISKILYSTTSVSGPWVTPNGTATTPIIDAFTFYGLPSTIAANDRAPVTINFKPPTSRSYAVYVVVQSNGGNIIFDAIAAGSDRAKAKVEFGSDNGTWTVFDNNVPFTFGSVTAGDVKQLQLRISNIGGINAAPLSLTVSKPPFGNNGIIGTSNTRDLAEGTLINTGSNATATLYCAPPQSPINVPTYSKAAIWTMNMNDDNFNHTLINLVCNVTTPQYGPLNAIGQAYYQYGGCYAENVGKRQLPYMIRDDPQNMTNELCISACSAAGYTFAATQYYHECWCGNVRPSTVIDDGYCNYQCAGNINEKCGGSGNVQNGASLSMFGDRRKWDGNATNTPAPWVNPGAFGFSSIGCWTDANNNRILNVNGQSANNSVVACLRACSGYTYAGVEYGGECYCGNTINSAQNQVDIGDCNMSCRDNVTDPCGGASRINMYQFGLNSNSSTTSATTSSLTSSSSLTVTSVSSSASLTTTDSSGFGTSTGSTSTPTSMASTTTSTTMTSASPSSTTNTQYQYYGCYTDSGSNRTLVGDYLAGGTNSPTTCGTFCGSKAYKFFGLEYGSECFCANSVGGQGTVRPDSECDFNCAGNATIKCGGNNRISIYAANSNSSVSSSSTVSTTLSTVSGTLSASSSTIAVTTTTTIAATTTTASPSATANAKYLYYGCFTDSTSNRTLVGDYTAGGTISPTTCGTFCGSKAYKFFGLEYGSECFCANSTGGPGTLRPDSECDFNCAGDSSVKCGGNNRISIYTANPITSLGCATDQPGSRTLADAGQTTDDMTVDKCIVYCTKTKNMRYIGVEYGKECYCGYTVRSSATFNADGCTMPCAGNSSQTCGGASRINIYRNENYNPTSNKATLSGTFAYQGCFVDSGNPRTLGAYSFSNSTGMTQELCVSTCQSKGYNAAGVEYASECWCATTTQTSLSGMTKAGSEAECNMQCSGDVTEWCGGPSRINVWLS